MLRDYGAEKPPPEFEIHAWRLFFKAASNARSGWEVETVSGDTGCVEQVDDRRMHVIFIRDDLESVTYAKLWTLKRVGKRHAPPQPR